MTSLDQFAPNSNTWPLFSFAILPHFAESLAALEDLAEKEDWEFRHTTSTRPRPVLFNYIQYTFARLEEQCKITISRNGEHACWNSGLVTEHQEAIYLVFDLNKFPDDTRKWHFRKFCRRGERDLNVFPKLPEMATYFEEPSCLVFDCGLDFRPNIEHIVEDHRLRFPAPFNTMEGYALQTNIKGAIENARERVRRSYKTAIPQFYQGRVQLLLPLCLSKPTTADLALVVERFDGFYHAATCLQLDMAYNNARQLARPDRDWLQP